MSRWEVSGWEVSEWGEVGGKKRGEEKGKDEEKGASGWVGASHIKSSVRDFL